MTQPMVERSLISALIPPNVGHIGTCISSSFSNKHKLLEFHGICASLPMDFFVKLIGASDIHGSTLESFPFPDASARIRSLIHLRALALNCLTEYYSQLWSDAWNPDYRLDMWTKRDSRLSPKYFQNLNSTWSRSHALRSDFERRQALVELDVLASMTLGLSLAELISIYQTQFPVMQQYECDTWFDANGRIVFTSSKGLPSVGMSRKSIPGDANYGLIISGKHEDSLALGWEDVHDLREGIVTREVLDNTQRCGPVRRMIEYHAPFERCDRVDDYRLAWSALERRLRRTLPNAGFSR